MALEFVTGSKTFEITDYSVIKSIGYTNYIQSEPFTVGGYDWVIQLFPQGIDEDVSDHVSVLLKVLDSTKTVRAMLSFSLRDWTTSKWSNTSKTSSPSTFSPSGRWGYENYIKRSDLEDSNYLIDDTLRIKCTLFVIRDGDNPDGNNFPPASYAPPNAPSNAYTMLPRQPTVRIYCEANKDLSVTVRNGTVVLAPADSNDHYQHWIKDFRYNIGLRVINGLPAFALVNRVTGEALKNPIGDNQLVSLAPYPNSSNMWTESSSTGFRAIRITDTPTLNMTALTYGGSDTFSDDGTKIVVQSWADTPIQHWKIVPYNSNVPY